MKIYFDGVLLDENKYMSLTQKGQMFDGEFKLGTTMSREFELEIPKADFNTNIQEVVIKIDDVDYAHLIIDSYTYNEGTNSVRLILKDKLVLAGVSYNAEPICPTTTLGILQDICSKIGVELGNTDFANKDVPVNFWNNELTARDYISFISELAGGFARIESDGKLYIRTYSNSTYKTINPDLCSDIRIGEKHKIERVVFDNGLIKFQSSEDTSLETLYINADNVYINNQAEFDNLIQNILDFEYWNVDTGDTQILNDILSGDVLKLDEYYFIGQFEKLTFYGVWQGGYKLEVDSKTQQETKVVGDKSILKNIKIRIDRDENIINQTVSKVKTLDTTVSDNSTAINNNYQELKDKFNDYTPVNRTVEVEKSVTKLQTDTYTKTEINTKLTDGSVTKVSTLSATIDDGGLTIEKSGAKTKGNFNESGVTVIDMTGSSNEELLFAGYDDEIGGTIVRSKDMKVSNYLIVGNNLRIEDYQNNRTGFFYTGGGY